MREKCDVMKVLSNFEKIQVDGDAATLGVAHFSLEMLRTLKEEFGVQVLLQTSANSIESFQRIPGFAGCVVPRKSIFRHSAGFWGTIISVRQMYWAAQGFYRFMKHRKEHLRLLSGVEIEYAPHHFQAVAGNGLTPRVITCHDIHIFDVPWKYRPREPLLALFMENLRSAGAIVTHFARPFRKLPELIEGVSEKVFMTHCPTLLGDIPLAAQAVREMSEAYGGDRALILYPGQLQEHKNHMRLLEAIRRLKDERRRVRLVCPGSGFRPEITSEIKQRAESLGLSDVVHFPGFMNSVNVRALYEICDVVVSPSLAEGGSAIAQEAVTFRKPFACSRIEAACDHLQLMGATAPLFDPHDVEEMAQALREALDSGPAWVERNESARLKVKTWTWSNLARRYLEIFRWVAAGGNPHERPAAQV